MEAYFHSSYVFIVYIVKTFRTHLLRFQILIVKIHARTYTKHTRHIHTHFLNLMQPHEKSAILKMVKHEMLGIPDLLR